MNSMSYSFIAIQIHRRWGERKRSGSRAGNRISDNSAYSCCDGMNRVKKNVSTSIKYKLKTINSEIENPLTRDYGEIQVDRLLYID